ncbi:MAG: pilus assembly PilX N-terminal domain-containing protein [Bacteroidetes bacterium]|nr:pilus assembly PilX N-terminal domain-containing protein [Bacteroidota bacterium]MBL7067213.1 pilus assembly PilX N-terminal domain-containing protein [Candidatus Neomarinimicrobiota bacterium]
MNLSPTYLASEEGSILGLVLIFFLISTIIGISFLGLASNEAKLTEQRVNRIKAFYSAEGGLRKAVWRVNHGSPASVAFSNSTVSVEYDSSTLTISSSGCYKDKVNNLSLILDFPFNHIVSHKDSISEGFISPVTCLAGREPKQFSETIFEPDMDFYKAIADTLYPPGDMMFQNDTLYGINYVQGNVTAKNLTVFGSLIVDGSISFIFNFDFNPSKIYSQQVPDTSDYYPAYYPAIIATSISVVFFEWVNIEGPVYASGDIDLSGTSLSGPIVTNSSVNLEILVIISDYGSNKFYNTPPGFKEIKSRGKWSYSN